MKMGCMKTISNLLTRNSDTTGLMKVCNNLISRLRSISLSLVTVESIMLYSCHCPRTTLLGVDLDILGLLILDS